MPNGSKVAAATATASRAHHDRHTEGTEAGACRPCAGNTWAADSLVVCSIQEQLSGITTGANARSAIEAANNTEVDRLRESGRRTA